MIDRKSTTGAQLEVQRVYEPSRLAAVFVSAAYAQVVPRRQRPVRVSLSVASTRVSCVVDDRRQMVDGAAPRAS